MRDRCLLGFAPRVALLLVTVAWPATVPKSPGVLITESRAKRGSRNRPPTPFGFIFGVARFPAVPLLLLLLPALLGNCAIVGGDDVGTSAGLAGAAVACVTV